MELRHLRYFVAVAGTLNFRQASDQLRVAQPALSSQIKDLEYELGVRLLDRNTGGVRLTEAGAVFLEEARLILDHARRAAVMAKEAAQGRRGKLKIGYAAALMMGFMPASLKAYHTQFPEVEVGLIEMTVGEQLAALEAGEINIGFTIGGETPLPRGLQSLKLLRTQLCVAMGPGHRLAKSTRVALADLQGETLLCLPHNRGLVSHGDIIHRIFAARGLKPGHIRVMGGADSLQATIESGLGVALIAKIVSQTKGAGSLYKRLKDTGDDLALDLYAVWREDQTSLLAANFIELLRKVKFSGKKTVA